MSHTIVTTAFVHTGHFNSHSRQHTVLARFEKLDNEVMSDIQKHSSHIEDSYTPDYTFTSPYTDPMGKGWDVGVPGGFRFQFVKTGDGFRLRSQIVYSESGPVVPGMVQRGMMKAEEIGAA